MVSENDKKLKEDMRLAANKVVIDGIQFTNHVVELEDGVLVKHYPLTEEPPHTEWLREVVIEDGQLLRTVRIS